MPASTAVGLRPEVTGNANDDDGASARGASATVHAVTRGCHGPLRELLAIDHRQALEVFVLRLQDLSEPTVDRQELLYNASLLAHYAQVSTQPDVDLPAPANLSAVFDHFVVDTTLMHDRLMMETAGAQCLLLAGFFEDQMHPRHNIRWYAQLGARFFSRAALQEQSRHKARLLDAIVRRFELWRRHHAQLSRELRDQPYLLTPPMPPTPSSGRKECSSIEVRDLPC